MAVPQMSQLRQGVAVNIVLKADQRSGKLTNGHVSTILTKGDHPRGIKVRLTDGQIGRVQSLASTPLPPTSGPTSLNTSESSQTHTPKGRDQTPGFHFQDDYRQDPTPEESHSLEDYIRIKPARRKGGKRNIEEQPDTAPASVQERLENEFPQVDSALVAAIIADHQDISTTREVLHSIS